MYVLDSPLLMKVMVGIWSTSTARALRPHGRGISRPITSDAILALAAEHGIASSVVRGCMSGRQGDRLFRASALEVDTPRVCLVDLVGHPSQLRSLVAQLLPIDRIDGVVVARDRLLGDAGRNERGGDPVAPFKSGIHLQIYTWERATIEGRPVYQAVSDWLRERGAWWVSVTRSTAGYTSATRPVSRRWRLSLDPAPIVVDVIDVTDRLQPHLNELAAWLGDDAMVVVQDVALAGRREPM